MEIYRRLHGHGLRGLRLALAGFIPSASLITALWFTAASAATQSVQIQNFAFSPAAITVQVGDTVTWTNQDPTDHTATFNSGPDQPDSGHLATGGSFSFTFTKAGSYTYGCSIHSSMKGSVTVQAATNQPAAASPTAAAATATPAPAATATPAPVAAVATPTPPPAAPTSTSQPAVLPRTGEPGLSLLPLALVGILALGAGALLLKRVASPGR